jgi:hypothetical protein
MFALTVFVAVGWSEPAASVRNEYIAKLQSLEAGADAQFRLANWAKRQGLNEEANGHLRAAVHIDPQFAPAQKALGRSLKAGIWETKDERQRRVAEAAKVEAERTDWSRRLAELGVESASAARPMTDAAAAAIEEYASSDEQRSLAALKVFRQSSQGAATAAILRQAVASRSPEVRKQAAAALAERPADHYLPTLVDFLRPLRAGKTVVLGVGEIWHWQEGSKMFTAIPASTPAAVVGASDAEANALEDRMKERQADADFVRANAVAALTAATGLELGDDYAKWRGAAMQITGSFIDSLRTEVKSVSPSYYRQDRLVIGSGLLPTNMPSCLCCLAAGTTVVAKRGDVPIDKIQVGELVLSRNLETGETAFKPVLGRTLRPRIAMQKLTIGDESFLATAGHPFWSPGRGWTKTKDLGNAASLGAESGEVRLTRSESAEAAQAYNLVVADFGTCFVGRSRVLTHDNSPIKDSAAK